MTRSTMIWPVDLAVFESGCAGKVPGSEAIFTAHATCHRSVGHDVSQVAGFGVWA